jgi:hypothetical protein
MTMAPAALLMSLTFGWVFHRLILLEFSQLVISRAFAAAAHRPDLMESLLLARLLSIVSVAGETLNFSRGRNILLLLL